MTPAGLAAVVAALAALGAIAYWALVITEGAYLGRSAVAWLYDKSAHEYDALKDFGAGDDAGRLARPLLQQLDGVVGPRVLDVACGTGRLPLELLSEGGFEGEVIGVDLSPAMVSRAWRKVGGWWPRAQLALADASDLPFASDTFDAVTCLEALEFTTDPRRTLSELARVVRPGGVVLVTNRVGWEARLMPGRAFPRERFPSLLQAVGLVDIRTERWQTYYDLVFARRPGEGRSAGRWPAGARCPACGAGLAGPPRVPACTACGSQPGWRDGAWDLRA